LTASSASRFANDVVLLTASISPDLFTAPPPEMQSQQSKKVFAAKASICVIARHAERAHARGHARGPQQGNGAWRAAVDVATTRRRGRRWWWRHIAYGRESPYLQGFLAVPPLPDDTYDVIVVDAAIDDDGELRLEVTVTLGPQIGRIVPLRNMHVETRRGVLDTTDPFSLLGVPGTLRVRHGVPSFRPETV
jgi:hypothetical protein